MTFKRGFQRGTIITAKYDYINEPYHTAYEYHAVFQELVIVDLFGNEYEIKWVSNNDEDFFGEGDKVSFLVDDEGNVRKLRLNPFGKGEVWLYLKVGLLQV